MIFWIYLLISKFLIACKPGPITALTLPSSSTHKPTKTAIPTSQANPGTHNRYPDSYTWWFVSSLNGLEGWRSEGDGVNYWLVTLD
jgi:hypothetical protein